MKLINPTESEIFQEKAVEELEFSKNARDRDACIARAQVYATLAVAAATRETVRP